MNLKFLYKAKTDIYLRFSLLVVLIVLVIALLVYHKAGQRLDSINQRIDGKAGR